MLIPTGYAQVNMRFTGVAVPSGAEMTFGVANGGDLSPLDIATVVDGAWAAANLRDNQCNDLSLTSILVKLGPNATGASAEFGTDRSGLASGAGVPPNVSVLIRKVTDSGGRAGRGRFYMPGFTEGSVDESGAIAGAVLSTMQGQADTFLDELAGAFCPMALLHGSLDAPIDVPLEVTALVVDARVATQRRRLRR